MARTKSMVLVAWVACASVSATGCGLFDLANAAAKLANNQIGALTGTDIKLLSDAAIAALNSQNPSPGLTPLTQAQADALAGFIKCTGVQTQQDLSNLQNSPNGISKDCLNPLAAAFQGTNQQFDPNTVTPQQLQALFSGLK